MSENESNHEKRGESGEFLLGDFKCRPSFNTITSPEGEVLTLKPKTMDLLVYLAENRGRVVSKDEIFEAVWRDTFVGDGVLWKCISELRQVLNDDPKDPQIVITVPKRGYRLDVPESLEGLARASVRRKGLPAIVIAFGLILVFAIWWFARNSSDREVSIPVGERPMILVAQIENQTGDPVLDGTLEYALENDLLATSSVRIASRARIEEALLRMGKPADTPVDEAVAREISLRDGEIAAIASGNVTRLGDEYQLGLRLLDPTDGDVLLASTKRGRESDSLLSAVDDMSFEMVERVLALNKLPPPPATDRKVRTASLEAFQSYLQGVEIYRRGQYREAAALFRRTVEIDPEFPSAHLMLGWSLRYQGLQDEAVESGRRAMALLDQATPAEQAFIQGTYHYWQEEYEEAWSHFELLLELEPEHPWAMFVLTTMAKRLGRFDRMAQLIQQAAAANPNLLVVQTRGAGILTGVLARLDLAKPLVSRARTIITNSKSAWGDETGWLGAWISSFGIWERWLEGDAEGALSEADRVRGWIESKRPQTLSPQRHANFLALQYLTLGRVKDARKLLRDFGAAPGLYLPEMTVLSSAAPDDELMRKFQQAPPGSAKALLRLLLLPPSSDGRTIGLPPPGPDEPREGPIFLAGVAIREDRPEEAIEELRRAKQLIFEGQVVAPGYLNFAVPYALRQSLVLLELARLHEANGQAALAIEALEELSSSRDQSYPVACIVWLFGRAYLADLYSRDGRAEEAEAIEHELTDLLKYADPDHPLKVRLSR